MTAAVLHRVHPRLDEETGLQRHLRIVHGYAITRLKGRDVVWLVMQHKVDHRGRFIHEVHVDDA
jgi:hypothetical protein